MDEINFKRNTGETVTNLDVQTNYETCVRVRVRSFDS